ncbi:hypothetical protein N7535_005625 [Penicillium sp. DV-2018c]|nr:hypothetical protein N7461_009199 [Penicillium sp. DV-2018c]KAJ5571965.1 hypothetical protein N7535_005625 [Penicillium sp. DV-2018c]
MFENQRVLALLSISLTWRGDGVGQVPQSRFVEREDKLCTSRDALRAWPLLGYAENLEPKMD